MSGETVPDLNLTPTKTQTPFDRFKAALSIVASVPKSAISKTPKKSTRKK
jgi:hypothetical protein